jgi:hypothetical protein
VVSVVGVRVVLVGVLDGRVPMPMPGPRRHGRAVHSVLNKPITTSIKALIKAAMHTGVEVILIGDSIPTGLPTSLVTAQRKVASTFDAEDVLACSTPSSGAARSRAW